MSDLLLYTTEIEPSEFLTVGIQVCTFAEDCGTHWQLYYRYETWLGFMPDVVLHGDKVYLRGTVEGIHQEITIELPSLAAAQEIGEKFHQIGVLMGEKLIPILKANTFITLGKGMGL